jgi:hypothetical protein
VVGHCFQSNCTQEYRGYAPLIELCMNTVRNYYRTGTDVYYLTIQESFVEAGHCQRRPGLHTDGHANADWGGDLSKGEGWWHSWGKGENGRNAPREGGIFLMSNVPNSCAVWDCCLKTPGVLGDCEDLRSRLSAYGPTMLEANRLYWITDRTPHEALPTQESGYRQFLRVVTEKVDVWYEQHSTPNPLGVVPPPECKIITENKFGILLK